MDTALLKGLIEKVLEKRDLYSWLQLYSVQTWNKIEFVRKRKGLRISETTITQNLVFDFWQNAILRVFPIEIYEAKDEKANGNDFEIFVETSKGFISFPCQAKICQANNKYTTITHKSGKNSGLQIDSLIKYANRSKGIPIYFLYNYCSDINCCSHIEEIKGVEIENFGISVAEANFIRNEFVKLGNLQKPQFNIPTFQLLHPNSALPIYEFFYNLLVLDVTEWLSVNNYLLSQIKFYNKDEISKKKEWDDMAPLPSIGFLTHDDIQKILHKQIYNSSFIDFNPKFRIVMSLIERKNDIYYLS